MIKLRNAEEKDLNDLNEINNHYILNSNATFDIQPFHIEQRNLWFRKYKNAGPYQLWVAEEKDKVIGCAYSSRYREHFAFDQTIETSVYVHNESRAKGVGSLLYEALFNAIKFEKIHRAVAGIALPNESSVNFHKKFGFTEVGTFDEYALKNGQYISSVWLQKKMP